MGNIYDLKDKIELHFDKEFPEYLEITDKLFPDIKSESIRDILLGFLSFGLMRNKIILKRIDSEDNNE